uniref:Secreted protein n=1 Tax=Knipowitschia caucasica TaxID=637954 RepID=A0AAV2JIR8_KNICA
MSSQVMHGLLTACFGSFGESANQSILLSVLGAAEWARAAPVTGLRWEMDCGCVRHHGSGTGPSNAIWTPREFRERGLGVWVCG